MLASDCTSTDDEVATVTNLLLNCLPEHCDLRVVTTVDLRKTKLMIQVPMQNSAAVPAANLRLGSLLQANSQCCQNTEIAESA